MAEIEESAAAVEEVPKEAISPEQVIRDDERSKATAELASSIVTHKQELESKLREEVASTVAKYREDNETAIRRDEQSRPNLILESPAAWNNAAEILAQTAEGKIALVSDEQEKESLRVCAAELRRLKRADEVPFSETK